MSKIFVLMERIWLAIALASFVFWIYKSYMTTMYDARYFLYAALFALVWFLVRQGVRKNFERKHNEKADRDS